MKKTIHYCLIIILSTTYIGCSQEVVPDPNDNNNNNNNVECVLQGCDLASFSLTFSGTNLFNSSNGDYYSVDGQYDICTNTWNLDCDSNLVWNYLDQYNDTEAELTYNVDGTIDLDMTFADDGINGDLFRITVDIADIENLTENIQYNGEDNYQTSVMFVNSPTGMCFDVSPFDDQKQLFTYTFTTIDIENHHFEGEINIYMANCETDSDGSYSTTITFDFEGEEDSWQ